MKTTVKTTIKGNENLFVKEDVSTIFDELNKKSNFIMLTSVSHNAIESKVIIRKSSIKMIK